MREEERAPEQGRGPREPALEKERDQQDARERVQRDVQHVMAGRVGAEDAERRGVQQELDRGVVRDREGRVRGRIQDAHGVAERQLAHERVVDHVVVIVGHERT